MESDDRCIICRRAPESITHLLRDCPKNAEVWDKLIGKREASIMANMDFKGWFSSNINGKVNTRYNKEWPNLFAITVRWLWKWRNKFVFNGEDRDAQNKVDWLLGLKDEVEKAFNQVVHRLGREGDSGNMVV